MEICYCETCGLRVPEAELKESRAIRVDGRVYCAHCKPASASNPNTIPVASSSKKDGSARISQRTIKSASASRVPTAAAERTVKEQPQPNRNTALLGVGAVVLVLAGAFLFLGKSAPPPAAPLTTTTTDDPKRDVAKHDSDPAANHAPAPKNQDTPAPRHPAEDPLETEAQNAFERISKNTTDPKAERIAKVEDFLKRYENTIIASRAALLLRDLRNSETPAVTTPTPTPAPAPVPPVPTTPVPEAAATTPAPPEKPPERKHPDVYAAHAAMAQFEDTFAAELRAGDAEVAAQELARAEKDESFQVFQSELKAHHKSLAWLNDFAAAVPKGIEHLKTVDQFELRQSKGTVFHVGSRAEFKVEELKDATINLSSKGMMLPVPLSTLSSDTRARLADLEWKRDGAGLLRRAFVQLLVKDASAKPPPVSAQKLVDEAVAAKADKEDSAYLESLIPILESSARDAMAARAWKDLVKTLARGDRFDSQSAVASFRKHFGDTHYAVANQKEIKKLTSTVEDLVMDGLVGYWNFEEADATTTADASGKGNKGTLVDGPELSTDVPDIAISNSHSLSFDGKKTRVTAARPLAANDNWSLCAWVNLTAPESEAAVVYVGVDTAGYGICLKNETLCVLYGMVEWVDGKYQLKTGTWVHVAAVRSNGHLQIYANGVPTGGVSDKAPTPPSNNFEIGHQAEAGINRFFHGKLDEVRVYERAITLDEIQILANVKKGER